jgi:hypothetical protein
MEKDNFRQNSYAVVWYTKDGFKKINLLKQSCLAHGLPSLGPPGNLFETIPKEQDYQG